MVELERPRNLEGFWLITCQIDVGGAPVSINAYMNGEKKCELLAHGGTVAPTKNDGQSCTFGSSEESCIISCR